MGADPFKTVRELILRLTQDGVPPAVAMKIEGDAISALVRADRDKRAAEAMPKVGATRAAANQGCARRTIYYRAARYLRKCKNE